jgi:V-type H+-transporting ATPase subunit a
MKIAVIIAIIHMSLGVIMKAFNAIFFKRKLDFYFEFIPQLIMLVLLFGYMDFLIVFKWLKDWSVPHEITAAMDTVDPKRWAPSIIGTMMNIGLKVGKTVSILISRELFQMEIQICGVQQVTHHKILFK